MIVPLISFKHYKTLYFCRFLSFSFQTYEPCLNVRLAYCHIVVYAHTQGRRSVLETGGEENCGRRPQNELP